MTDLEQSVDNESATVKVENLVSLFLTNHFQDIEVKKEPMENDNITCYSRILCKIQTMKHRI